MAKRDISRPVAVTGIGILTSLGEGREENWRALTAGQSGIRRIRRFPIDNLRTTIAGTVDFLAGGSADTPQITAAAARRVVREALAQSGLGRPGDFPGPLFLAGPPIEHEWPQRRTFAARAGSTAYGAMVASTRLPNEAHEQFLNGFIADRIAEEFGTRGAPATISTACASGATVIQLGVEAIRRGEAAAALAVGADASVQPEAIIRFSLLSALSTANEDPARAAKPFSKNRDGFVMAEGAAALVLEDAEAARARGAEILGYVLGCGEAADNFHRTRSSPDGAPIIRCMRNALADAGLDPVAIDYVNAHGTGTPENDKMETLGLQALLGERLASVPVSSNKSMIGHTLTAAGLVEAGFSMLTLRDQLLPPTINYNEPDPAIPLDVVPNRARAAKVAHILSNSFGFGGQNTSLVLGLDAA
ncbi:MAG TPA: beta-ketoacyl-ACP synthase [Hypericibacter adhaerens]|uniref:Beta-ketoacyl-ACP synthase II n=1 Tax=Hypericibacter adhaerens TaxID=2602016 RepID=A0A5J6MUK8_9PROT|nr:beta-ketoacyl-ACP synthase [Hypericibacter adhaerens]QEX21342.1 beta-ketoacyl-ACP synthase II [Hypericibacter adhaerens]HWA45285.1 beta-ketoacyl-ACP synthase [Hypericibacter adhaerens]